jgi:hypothetical protein
MANNRVLGDALQRACPSPVNTNYPIPENYQSHFLRDTNAIQNMVLPFPDREPSWTNRIQGEWI